MVPDQFILLTTNSAVLEIFKIGYFSIRKFWQENQDIISISGKGMESQIFTSD